jgi:hypothetical protein
MPRILPALIIAATAMSLAPCSKKQSNGSLTIDMNSPADEAKTKGAIAMVAAGK